MPDTASTTHVSLLARLSAGADPAAWQEFCDRYGQLIQRFARQWRLQPADCDDVMQEVFTSLTRSMPGFQYDPGKGRFRSYLKTVVVHAIQRILCQKPGDAALESNVLADEVDSSSEEVWEKEWRQYHLQQALRQIDAEFNAKDRAAFESYAVQGRDAKGTAEELGLSLDQVYQAKSRILARLTEIIERQVQEEG